MSRNDTTPTRTPEETARLLAEQFFPKDEVKALRAAELITRALRDALESDRWARMQDEEWGCPTCATLYRRRDLLHEGVRELCPKCLQPAAKAERIKLARAEAKIRELEGKAG